MHGPDIPKILIGLLLWAGACGAGEPPALTRAEMQQVLRTLQTQFAQPEAVGFAALNRAAIAGLLREHPEMLQLLIVADASPAAPLPLLVESITPHVAFLRPGSFRKEDIEPMKDALTTLSAGEATTLILDLRATVADGDPSVAAALAELFLPPETLTFLFPEPLKTRAAAVWSREMIVLIDRDTCNVGEVLAAVLKTRRRAFLIGETTRGRTAAIVDLPLRKVDGGNLVLRYAAQRVVIAESPDPFGNGVGPDIFAALPPAAKRAVFELQSREGMARSIFQQARPRINEAALVARTNPEIPERLARTAGTPLDDDAPLIDRPLQLAADILIARRLLEPGAER